MDDVAKLLEDNGFVFATITNDKRVVIKEYQEHSNS